MLPLKKLYLISKTIGLYYACLNCYWPHVNVMTRWQVVNVMTWWQVVVIRGHLIDGVILYNVYT